MHIELDRFPKLAVAVAIAAGSALFLLGVGDAQSQVVAQRVLSDPRTPISSLPFTITECGSYYVTDCLLGTPGTDGITIAADSVTIDLNGFSLSGVNGGNAAIVASGNRYDVTVRNGSIFGWATTGVELSTAFMARVEGVRTLGNGSTGVAIGKSGELTDCNALSNFAYGYVADEGARIRNCTAFDCHADGFVVGAASSLFGCISRGNTGNGFTYGGGSVLEHCLALSNYAGHGFVGGASSVLTDCVSRINGGNGIDASSHTSISGSIATGNTGFGVRVHGGDSRIVDNVIVATGGAGGIELDSNATLVTTNEVVGSINLSREDVGPSQSASTATSPFANFP